MPLSELTKKRFGEWGIEVRHETKNSIVVDFREGASRYAIADVLLTLLHDRSVNAFALQQRGEAIHAEIQFHVGR